MRQAPRYLIIGNGRVARHMRRYFSLLDLPCDHWHRALDLALLDGMKARASHILILISDGAVEDFARTRLKDAPGLKIHFSGALVTDAAAGAHPLMTFGPELYDAQTYASIPFITDAGAPPFATLLPGLKNPHAAVAAEKKALYHALCVMAGNFSCILWQKFFDGLEKDCGIPPALGKAYLRRQTENLLDNPAAALTGPLARGDRDTVEKNLRSLEGDPFHAVYAAFAALYDERIKA